MTIRAKMQLESVIPNAWGGAQAIYRCSYESGAPEDASFCKATPSGEARFTIDNPAVMSQLVIGHYYYFDISEVPPVPQSNPQ